VRASATRGRPMALFFGIAAVVLAVDQLTKFVAVATLADVGSTSLVGDWVRLTLTHNTGSAFGLVSSTGLLIAAGCLVCVVVAAYAVLGGLAGTPRRRLPLGLVLGGALGNLLDRVRTGGVVDFVDLRVWPVFNIADVAITVGVALLAFDVVRRH
jgi:signal peptidase II